MKELLITLTDDISPLHSLYVNVIDDGDDIFSTSAMLAEGRAFLSTTPYITTRKALENIKDRTIHELSKVLETNLLYWYKLAGPSYNGVPDMVIKQHGCRVVEYDEETMKLCDRGFLELMVTGQLARLCSTKEMPPVDESMLEEIREAAWKYLGTSDSGKGFPGSFPSDDNKQAFMDGEDMEWVNVEMMTPKEATPEVLAQWRDVFYRMTKLAKVKGGMYHKRLWGLWRAVIKLRMTQMPRHEAVYFPHPLEYIYLPITHDGLWDKYKLRVNRQWADVPGQEATLIRNCGWSVYRVGRTGETEYARAPNWITDRKKITMSELVAKVDEMMVGYTRIRNDNESIRYSHYPIMSISATKMVGMKVCVHPYNPFIPTYGYVFYHNVDNVPGFTAIKKQLTLSQRTVTSTDQTPHAEDMDLHNVIVIYANPYDATAIDKIWLLVSAMPTQNFLFVNFPHSVPVDEQTGSLPLGTLFDFTSTDDELERVKNKLCKRFVMLFAPEHVSNTTPNNTTMPQI